MAYLHCHACGWSQDDFWDEKHNPLRALVNMWEKTLLDESLDMVKDYDAWDDSGNHYIEHKTNRQVLCAAIQGAVKNIDGMVYKTQDEFLDTGDDRCPVCGQQDLDID